MFDMSFCGRHDSKRNTFEPHDCQPYNQAQTIEAKMNEKLKNETANSKPHRNYLMLKNDYFNLNQFECWHFFFHVRLQCVQQCVREYAFCGLQYG